MYEQEAAAGKIVRLANGGVSRSLTFELMHEMEHCVHLRGDSPKEIRCGKAQIEAFERLFETRARRADPTCRGHAWNGIPIIENDGIMPGVMAWFRDDELIGVIVDLETRIHIERITVHTDDPDRLAVGIAAAFTKKVTGEIAIPTDFGPLTIKSDPTLPPGRIRMVARTANVPTITVNHQAKPVCACGDPKCSAPEFSAMVNASPTLVDGLTPEQCRERWLVNRRAVEEFGGSHAGYDLTPAQIEAGKRYRTILDTAREAFDASLLRVLVKTSDAERKARETSVVVDLEDE